MTTKKKGAAEESPSLPRLGSPEAGEAVKRTREVEIPGRGVSVVIAPPSVEILLAVQEKGKLEVDDRKPRDSFEGTVELVSEMLVDPEMDVDALRAEVSSWEMSDWVTLQRAAIELSGMGAVQEAAAEEAFPGKED